jgi:hypothetical protein
MELMTLTQLTTLNDNSTERELTIDDGILFGKELLGEYRPYTVRKDIAGENIILFNTHFVNCMRQALTDGCVDRMGKLELKFWLEFVAYQNDIQDGVRNDVVLDISKVQAPLQQRELALYALDEWMQDELNGVTHRETKECYVPYVVGV